MPCDITAFDNAPAEQNGSNGNAFDLYLGDGRFESRPGHQQFWLVSVVFLSLSTNTLN
jgi:hypothetical protein